MKVGISPGLVQPDHTAYCSFREAGVVNRSIVFISIGMCQLIASPHIPDQSFFIPCKIYGISDKAVVRLIIAENASADLSFRKCRSGNEVDHTCDGIGAVG